MKKYMTSKEIREEIYELIEKFDESDKKQLAILKKILDFVRCAYEHTIKKK